MNKIIITPRVLSFRMDSRMRVQRDDRFRKNQRDLRVRNVHREEVTFSDLPFAPSLALLSFTRERRKEVEIACLGILCLQGEIRSTKKEANS